MTQNTISHNKQNRTKHDFSEGIVSESITKSVVGDTLHPPNYRRSTYACGRNFTKLGQLNIDLDSNARSSSIMTDLVSTTRHALRSEQKGNESTCQPTTCFMDRYRL